MAILNGILKKLNGSAGSLTFKQVNGQTVVSEKPSTVRNSRTPSQQRQRTKWGNVVQMYKGICPLINYGFESKPVGCSDYNMFMKTNMKLTDIYLTREEVAGGGCIAAHPGLAPCHRGDRLGRQSPHRHQARQPQNRRKHHREGLLGGCGDQQP